MLGGSRNSPRKLGTVEGEGYRFYNRSSLMMPQCANDSVALTVTSPPYWNAIDYNTHVKQGNGEWYRKREYQTFGDTFDDWLTNIEEVFKEVYRVTIPGGFCAVVIGTILHKGNHYPAPMRVTQRLTKKELGWEFHQDIVWNKVTGGVKRAGSFIQNPRLGYYYPNIMTEYILVFRKPGAPRRGRKKTLDIDELFKRDIANNVWHIAPIPPRSINHPCPYPEEIVRRLLLLYSETGDEILDPFLGSGQTAIAALREGRVCVGYDIELTYLELAEARLRQTSPARKCNLLPRWDKMGQNRGASGSYASERRVFDRLRSDCSEDARAEYERSILALLRQYNTTIYENRFIVGGAVEVFTYALLRAVGIDCYLYADQSKSGDISLPGNRKLSVKGVFTGGTSDVRLLNKQGGGTRTWGTATLFVISDIGVVYGTPKMVDPKHIHDVGDAVILKRAGLQALIDDPRNVCRMSIPRKPATEITGFSHKASTAVARQILEKTNGLNRAFTHGQDGT